MLPDHRKSTNPLPRKEVFFAFICCFYWSGGTALLVAQSFDPHLDTLQGELWTSVEPLSSQEVQKPLTDSELIQELLQECRLYFSGMIYGWKFYYRPYDKARQAQEVLQVEQLGQVSFPSSRLLLNTIRPSVQENRLYYAFLYRLHDFEITRRQAWAGYDSLSISGQAEATLQSSRTETRYNALQQALKQALRRYLRPRRLNKPSAIHGEALLKMVPLINVKKEKTICKASFWLKQLHILPYPAY